MREGGGQMSGTRHGRAGEPEPDELDRQGRPGEQPGSEPGGPAPDGAAAYEKARDVAHDDTWHSASAPVGDEDVLMTSPFEDDLADKLAVEPWRLPLPAPTLFLAVSILLVAGFIGGVYAQKWWGGSDTASSAAPFAGSRGGYGQGGPAAGGGFAPGGRANGYGGAGGAGGPGNG